MNSVVLLDDVPDINDAPVADSVVADDDVAAEALPPGLEADGEGYRLTLRRPLTLQFKGAGGTVREEKFGHLPIRRLTGGDMRAMMMSGRADGSLMLLEAAVMLPASRVKIVIDRLDAADMLRAMAVVGFLSGSSPTTGR